MPPPPTKKPSAGHIERRTWDIETYEKKAQARRRQEESGAPLEPPKTGAADQTDDTKPEFRKAEEGAAGPQGSKRAFLQARTEKITDLDERVGSKVEVILEDTIGASKNGVIKKMGAGWHCSVCNCMLKDSNAYLDHINGRRHLKQLGFSMRVERSTESDLMAKLSQLKKKKEQALEGKEKEEIIDYNQLVMEKDEEEQKRIEERRRKRKERRKRNKEGGDAVSKTENEGDKAPENEVGEEVEEEEIDPMAALMGFSGFGGSNRT